jgi:hypothetical protein
VRSIASATRILDLDTNQVTMVPGSTGMFSPHWSPDGHSISALPTTSLGINIFDLATQRWSTPWHKLAGFETWSKDSQWIFFIEWQENPGIYRVRASGGEAERIVDGPRSQRQSHDPPRHRHRRHLRPNPRPKIKTHDRSIPPQQLQRTGLNTIEVSARVCLMAESSLPGHGIVKCQEAPQSEDARNLENGRELGWLQVDSLRRGLDALDLPAIHAQRTSGHPLCGW